MYCMYRTHTHMFPSMESGWVMSASPYCYCDGSRFKGQESAFISQTYSLSLSHSLPWLCLSTLSFSCPHTTSVSCTHTHKNTQVGKCWGWCETDNSLLCQTHTPYVVDWPPFRSWHKSGVQLEPIKLQIWKWYYETPGHVPISVCLPTEQGDTHAQNTQQLGSKTEHEIEQLQLKAD